MQLFEYEPFDLGGKSFRLLMLHPGASGDIACDLFQATLEPGNIIPYEALSYAWGSNDLSESITVNRKRLPVTKSLFHALSHLRRDEGRILWVDAVCIDQGNTAERGHQVGHMGDIYREAEQVLIWLGPSSYETKILMDFLKRLHREASGHKDQKGLGRVQEEWLSSQQDSGNDRAALCQLQRAGLMSLFEEPWFTRIWVLQEVSHARAASVCCGRWSVPAHMLATAATLVGVDPDPQCKAVLDLMPNPSTRRSAKTKSLHTLLRQFRGSRATEPRDMVYAMLGIASDMPEGDPGGLLQPDYFKSETELIRDTQRFLFFSDLEHQLGQFSDMKAFLAVLPELTDMTFRNAIVNGHMTHVKTLCERDQQYEIPYDILLDLGREEMRLVLRDLTDLRSSNLTLGQSARDYLFERCDSETAQCILELSGEILEITENLVIALRRSDGKQRARRACELLLGQARGGGVQVTQGAFAEMAAFCDAELMRGVIERQQEVYFITARVALLLSLNERHGREVMTMLLAYNDGWVQVTEDGLLKILEEYNDAHILRLLRCHGMLSATVTGLGTNPLDPEASWASTVDFDAEPSVFQRQAEDVRQRLRESREGIVKAQVVYVHRSSATSEAEW
ncbi:HET domain-containing protein [Colletotrichum cereale]|nr:HET domain-containing protein [Colletotrichum cereale]